jgi:hypothetical protein
MKIRPVRAELLQAGRRIDGHDEANSRISRVGERAGKKSEKCFSIDCFLNSEKSTGSGMFPGLVRLSFE